MDRRRPVPKGNQVKTKYQVVEIKFMSKGEEACDMYDTEQEALDNIKKRLGGYMSPDYYYIRKVYTNA